MARSSLLVALLLVAIAGPWLSPARASQGGRVASPRAQFTVTVFNEPTLSGKYTVDLDGTFEFPLVGRVNVGGLTAREIEVELGRQLANGYLKNPQVTVAIEQSITSQRVFVIGEVRAPGPQVFGDELTLLEALVRVGLTTPAAASELLVIRPPRDKPADAPVLPSETGDAEVIRVNLKDLQSGGLGQSNLALRDGDTVFVPRAPVVYMTGYVRSQGALQIQPGTTLLQALSLAGGVSERGSASRIRIIRIVAGKRTEIKVKMTDLVEPGDTIVVPSRHF